MTLINKLRIRTKCSNFKEVKNLRNIPLFVYGRFKKNNSLNHKLNGLPYLGEASTMLGTYKLLRENNVPMIQKHKFGHGVSGEVYLVTPLEIFYIEKILRAIMLDNFYRDKISIWLNEQKEKNCFLNNVQTYFVEVPTTPNVQHGIVNDIRKSRGNITYKMVL